MDSTERTPRGRVAFFDVDHTITRKSTARRYAVHAAKSGFFPFRTLLSIPVHYLSYRFGNMKTNLFTREFDFLRGISYDDMVRLARETFDLYIKADIYQGAEALIRRLKEEGQEIVLATSSIEVIIRPLAEYLKVSHTIASRLEFVNGVSTGRFLEYPNFGEEKKQRVLEFLEKQGISLEDSSFYSDSKHDRPLLESAGKAVAVHPDRTLKRIARQMGWEIINFSE